MQAIIVDTAGVAVHTSIGLGAWLAIMESTDDYGCVCAHAEPFATHAEAVAYERGDNFGVRYEPSFDWAAYHAAHMAALAAEYEAEHAALEQRFAAAHSALDKLGAPRVGL